MSVDGEFPGGGGLWGVEAQEVGAGGEGVEGKGEGGFVVEGECAECASLEVEECECGARQGLLQGDGDGAVGGVGCEGEVGCGRGCRYGVERGERERAYPLAVTLREVAPCTEVDVVGAVGIEVRDGTRGGCGIDETSVAGVASEGDDGELGCGVEAGVIP